MSYVDDCYEELMIEQAMKMEAIETYLERYTNQKVVDDVVTSFKENIVDESSKLECVSREILKTVAKTKTLSIKQKTCLVRVLVSRCAENYEVGVGC